MLLQYQSRPEAGLGRLQAAEGAEAEGAEVEVVDVGGMMTAVRRRGRSFPRIRLRRRRGRSERRGDNATRSAVSRVMRMRERAVGDGTVCSRCLLVLMLYLCCFCGVLGELNRPIIAHDAEERRREREKEKRLEELERKGHKRSKVSSGFRAVMLRVKRGVGEGVRLRVRVG